MTMPLFALNNVLKHVDKSKGPAGYAVVNNMDLQNSSYELVFVGPWPGSEVLSFTEVHSQYTNTGQVY